jgi:hypothetical protein
MHNATEAPSQLWPFLSSSQMDPYGRCLYTEHTFCPSLEVRKASQCKGSPECNLHSDVFLDERSEIDALDISLQLVVGHQSHTTRLEPLEELIH